MRRKRWLQLQGPRAASEQEAANTFNCTDLHIITIILALIFEWRVVCWEEGLRVEGVHFISFFDRDFDT